VFAGLLNRGIRGSLVVLISFFLLSLLLIYFSPISLESNNYPDLFYNYFAQKITGKLAIVSLNFLCIGLAVILSSFITVNQEIVEKTNYFPVFLFLLLSVTCVSPSQISPQIFTNVFILFSIYKLLDIYRKDNVLRQIFDAAFWLCFSAFITISSIISFPLFFIILLILRPFNWREWAVAFLGFLMPVFIYDCIAYLSDFSQGYILEAAIFYFRSLRVPSFSEYYLPLSFLLFILMLLSLLNNLSRGFGNTIKKQRTKTILIWFLLFASFGFFSGGATSSSIILTYAFPLSFFIGDFLYGIKQQKTKNTILTILILCAFIVFAGQLGLF
jgi:hypothetical protein